MKKRGKGKRGRKPVILIFFVFFSFEKVELQKKAIDFYVETKHGQRERERAAAAAFQLA